MSNQARIDIALWGASGHALVVADIIQLSGNYNIVGYLDDVNPERWGERFNGSKVLGGADQLMELRRNGIRHLVLAFGDCQARLKLAGFLASEGWLFATITHPRATIADDVLLGAGTVVAAGGVINPATRVGDQVIINTSASVDHQCVIEDGAHVAPGATLAGHVHIGRGAWIGVGAVIKDRVTIGAGSLIGAGALVLDDVPEAVVAYGSPARVIGPASARR